MAIYMNYEGIQGDVTAEGFANQIELHSFQWGVGRGIGAPTGSSKNREASAPNVAEVMVTKRTDKASIGLLQAALEGEGKTVTITFVKTDAGKLEKYLEYILEKTMISGYATSAGGDRPTETISLNFTKFQVEFVQMADENTGADNPKVGYDIGKANTT